jgi:hypothetical protein
MRGAHRDDPAERVDVEGGFLVVGRMQLRQRCERAIELARNSAQPAQPRSIHVS